MRHAAQLLALMLFAALMVACSKPRALGDRYQITVVADSMYHNLMRPLLEDLFSDNWISPQDESRLDIRWANPSEVERELLRRNLILATAGPAEGPVGLYLEKLLGSDVEDRIRSEEAFVFTRREAFARGQQLLILAAPTQDSFRRQLLDRGSQVKQTFLDYEWERNLELQQTGRKHKGLVDSLARHCGFRMQLPPDWFVVQELEDLNFIRFRRLGPDRWITVYWTEGEDSLWADEEGLRTVRKKLGRRYWDKDYTEEDYGRFSRPELGGFQASLLEGLWGTDARVGGGPFLFYALHSPSSGESGKGRTYYIDAAVLNPGGPKSPYLHQLSTLASSFQPTDPAGEVLPAPKTED